MKTKLQKWALDSDDDDVLIEITSDGEAMEAENNWINSKSFIILSFIFLIFIIKATVIHRRVMFEWRKRTKSIISWLTSVDFFPKIPDQE